MWYEIVFWILCGILGVAALFLLICLGCFLKVFYSPKRKPLGEGEYEYPPGDVYVPFYPQMKDWMERLRKLPHEDVSVTSFDGLTLRGAYYEYAPNSPVELLFHGYQGTAERDLSGAIDRCAALGRSMLIVNQRGSGPSDGRVITFGVKEKKDCLTWIDFAVKKFGKDRTLMIGGVSMGATTVLLASEETLPENVVSVMADCGFSSAKEIIKKVVREMGLPADMVYPFIRFGGIIFGGFDPNDSCPIESVKRAKTPVIFLHGDADDYVPYQMSVDMYAACNAPKKKLITLHGAGHGLAYPNNPDEYVEGLREFQEECGF
ncbi:MAG: alpha/beta hydrolase [Clostridiales bacterium]|nr:alpha/beta hydrolase [Clostridiales bacterium]